MSSLHLAQELLNIIYPVNSIYLSMSSTNPSSYFGGTWTQISQGCAIVGVNTSDTDFASAGKTGGEKTHTLSVSEMPSHNHFDFSNTDGFALHCENVAWGNYVIMTKNSTTGEVYNYQKPTSQGKSSAHNNLQPYFCCYIFKRIA